MKRKNNADVLRENIFVLILSGFMLVAGIFLPWLPHLIHTTEMEELTGRTIVVEKLKYVPQRHGSGYYRLFATDGTAYNLSGDHDIAEVKAILRPNTRAEVRYHKNGWFGTKYAEIVEVNGNCIVRYDNNENQNFGPMYVIAAVCVLVGFVCLIPVVWEVRQNRRQQKKRDGRIAKKYETRK